MNPELEKWLRGKPPIIRVLATKYPPGTPIDVAGTMMWVVSYDDDGGLGVSAINPAEDFEAAVASRTSICACCLKQVHEA